MHKGFETYPRPDGEVCCEPLKNMLSSIISLAELLLQQSGSPGYLISKVFGVVCSALIFMPAQTVGYISSLGNFSEFMSKLISKMDTFLTAYDRRLLTLGLLSVFRLKIQQGQVDQDAIKWFECCTLTLHVQRVEEDIKGFKAATTGPKDKRKKLLKETRSIEEKQDLKLYNMIIGKGIDLDRLLEDDEPSNLQSEEDEMLEDILKFVNSAKLCANRSVHKLHSPINKVDEFAEFHKIFADFKQLMGHKLGPEVLDRMSSIARECLPGVLKSVKIKPQILQETTDSGVTTAWDQPPAPRKIAKIKERTVPGVSQTGNGELFAPQLN